MPIVTAATNPAWVNTFQTTTGPSYLVNQIMINQIITSGTSSTVSFYNDTTGNILWMGLGSAAATTGNTFAQWGEYRQPPQRNREYIPPRELPAPHVRREHIRERMKRASARMRALSLLLDQMTAEQRDSFHTRGHFLVQGGRSKTMYRVNGHGCQGNVDVLSVDGRVSMRLCAHANMNEIPLPDQLLAQKLMLEFDEEEFLRIANRRTA